MLFKLFNTEGGRQTHCGVLEFTAEEGCCYIPFWMMRNLLIEEGALVTVTNVSLPKATFVKLQPQSTDFLEISNPRVVLEHALRNYSCVTKDDIIQIPYNGKNYQFALKDVRPAPAACIIETDCEVDFDAPVGYVEPERRSRSNSSIGASSLASSRMMMGDELDEMTEPMDVPSENMEKPTGIRIVDGIIVRPDDTTTTTTPQTEMLAEATGRTGVQKNAAILEQAPEVDYWAVAAGDGARLDGRKPAILKDASGTEIDVRKLRAEAASRRATALNNNNIIRVTSGKTVAGKSVEIVQSMDDDGATTTNARTTTTTSSGLPPSAATTTQRKNKRIGSKYSRLKGSNAAFQGSANQFQPDQK